MKYIFLSLNPMYHYIYKPPTRNLPLYDLYNHLDDAQMRWIKVSNDENDPNKVIIWSTSQLKEFIIFSTRRPKEPIEEKLAYSDQYHEYSRKRFAEMPAIRITRANYEALKKQFEEFRKRKPQYLIMREHDDGHVDMLEKNELSQEDVANMNREEKIYRNYVKRLQAYQKAHPNRYPTWRSPADNEFESNFALYDPADEQGVD